jgi:hypothetical protein
VLVAAELAVHVVPPFPMAAVACRTSYAMGARCMPLSMGLSGTTAGGSLVCAEEATARSKVVITG